MLHTQTCRSVHVRVVTAEQKTVENQDWAVAGRRAFGPPGRWTVAGRGSRAAFSKTSKKRALRHALWETSAFQIFHGGNSTFINSFAKTQFLCFTLPPTQHHSFFVLRMTSYELEWQKKINISYVGGAVVVMCLKLWMKKDSLADDSVRDFKWSAKIMPFLCNW